MPVNAWYLNRGDVKKVPVKLLGISNHHVAFFSDWNGEIGSSDLKNIRVVVTDSEERTWQETWKSLILNNS